MNFFEEVAKGIIGVYGAPIALVFGILLLITSYDIFRHTRSQKKREGAVLALLLAIALIVAAVGIVVANIVNFVIVNSYLIAFSIGLMCVVVGAFVIIRWWLQTRRKYEE